MKKVLCVTGASSDVGYCLIDRVADKYDAIVCHYRSSIEIIERLQEKHGSKIIPVMADFSDEKSTLDFIDFVNTSELSPEHFVHLVSDSSYTNIKYSKTNWTQFEMEINISFRSAVLCTQAFVPFMVKSKKCGKVVFMLSSQTTWEPLKPYSASYTSTKYALNGLMKSLSAEYASKGVTVNAVSPSMIDTKFLDLPEIVKKINAEASPIKRLLSPEDVVPAFEFILSPGADTLTGQNIPVTAGC